MRRRRRAAAAIALAALALAAACGNTERDDGGSGQDKEPGGSGTVAVDQPGVTDTEIRVGGVASVSNPLGGSYGAAFEGVKAYFDMVNAEGGVHGRRLVLAVERDDQVLRNKETIEAMLAQDDVFAVLPIASLVFNGAQTLADQGVPGFGWNINREYTGKDNLFGHVPALCGGCPTQILPWLAEQIGAKKVAVYAYGIAEQSKICADSIRLSFEEFPTAEIVAFDDTLQFGSGGPTDAQVLEAKEKGARLFATCLDQNAVKSLGEKLRKYDVDAVQFMLNAYDAKFIAANAEIFEGSYTGVPFLPFETDPAPEALEQFRTWMAKGGYEESELAIVGWIAAAQFVTGLREAGRDFTRQKVIDALNSMTDVDADGLISGIDWTRQHLSITEDPNAASEQFCAAIVEVVGGKFEVAFAPPDKPFICFTPAKDGKISEPTFES